MNGKHNNIGRRSFLKFSGATLAAAAVGANAFADSEIRMTTQPLIMPQGIKALFFDVQGTTVDFYSTIVQEGEKFAKAHGFNADWALITEQWRNEYRVQLDKVIKKERSWVTTDVIYREALDLVLVKHPWGNSLTSSDRDELNSVWSKLTPWADTKEGLARLKSKFTISTLSNGSMASVINIAKLGKLPFDAVLTAELIKSSKPDPNVYQMALNSIGVKASEAMMVACHKYDLKAAKQLGFKVAFIARPLEFGPVKPSDTKHESYFDYYANSITELASMLNT